MKVRILCGANAYAMIQHEGGALDIKLAPGRGAQRALHEYAAEQRARAADILARADLAERAAHTLGGAA